MQSHEAQPGTAVRVLKSFRNPELEGLRGTIKNRFGDAEYSALDVQLEDGRLELFWFHQLERVEESRAAVQCPLSMELRAKLDGLELPFGYKLERDGTLLIRRRSEGAFVAASCARGMDLIEVELTLWEDGPVVIPSV